MIEIKKLQWALEKTLNRDDEKNSWKVVDRVEPVHTEISYAGNVLFKVRPDGSIYPDTTMPVPESIADFAINYRLRCRGKEPFDKTPLYKSAENINLLENDSTEDRLMIIRDKNKDIVCTLVLPHNSVFKIALSGGYSLSDSMEAHQDD